jgi:hypothetical protein
MSLVGIGMGANMAENSIIGGLNGSWLPVKCGGNENCSTNDIKANASGIDSADDDNSNYDCGQVIVHRKGKRSSQKRKQREAFLLIIIILLLIIRGIHLINFIFILPKKINK